MPTYEYKCDVCWAKMEYKTGTANELPAGTLGRHYYQAGKCGGTWRRIYSTFNIVVR